MPLKLEHILKRVDALPSLPNVALQVIQMTNDSDATVKDLQFALSQDPALAASILRQANSAYYGFARRISSLTEAIVILGFQSIHGLAMAAAVSPMMKQPLLGYNTDQEGLWKHSLLTAMIAKRLCIRVQKPHGETAFTAGLLHDIGKLVLSIYVNEVSPFLLESINTQKLAFTESEEKIIGFDHAAVGGMIARHWNLPEIIVEPIAFHHKPSQSTQYQDLTYIVHLANVLANILGLGGGVDSFLNPLEPDCLERFQLNESDLELIIADFGEILNDPNIFG